MPEGYTEVTEAEFFAYVGPRNIHPDPQREHVNWREVSTHRIVGWATPGYMRTGPEVFALESS